MRFEITRGNEYYWGENPPWLVERILIPGERYLVACFEEKDDAIACLDSIKKSLEAKKGAPCVIPQ